MPLPEGRQEEHSGRLVTRPPETTVRDESPLHTGRRSIRRPLGTADNVGFDLYDVGDAITYHYILRLPIQNYTGRVVAARDTIVHRYRLSKRVQ